MINAEYSQEKPKNPPELWLSVSKIKTFNQCPAKYRYNYIDRLPRKSWDHFTFGNFLHEILEKFHEELMSDNEQPWHQLMSKCFSEISKNEEFQKDLTKSQKDESFKILNVYLKQITAQQNKDALPKVIGVETPFYVNINDKILLNGYIDRVQIDPDDILHVSDYKTTKNKKYLVKDDFQLLTYSYVMCLADTDLKKVRASYMLLRHNFETINKTYNRKKIMTVGDKYLEYAEKIDREKLWRPKPSNLCRWCDFCDVCPATKQKEEKLKKFGENKW